MTVLAGIIISGAIVQSWAAPSDVWSNLGLYGGSIYDIAIDPAQPDKIFSGAYLGGGLYRTTNGGSSWQAVEANNFIVSEDTFKNHAVWAVEIAPGNSNIIWAVHNSWAEYSTDGGLSWTHVFNREMQRDCAGCGGESDNLRYCHSLAIDPNDTNTVYIGTGGPNEFYSSGAIYKTTDGGQSWSKINQGNDFDFPVIDLSISPANNNIIWAVTSSEGFGGWAGSLYRSADGGASWDPIFSLTPYGGAFISVAVKPDDPNIVFTGSGFGVYRHYHDGSAWQLGAVIVGSNLASAIAFDPQNPNMVYAAWKTPTLWGGDGLPKVSRSLDGGLVWETYSLEASGVNEFDTLAVHPTDPEILYAGDYSLGLFMSQDHGQTWSPINDGINAVVVYDVAVDPNDRSHFLAATVSGVYEKQENTDWMRRTSVPCRAVAFHPTDAQTYWGGQYGYLLKSTDGGQNWTFSDFLGNGDVQAVAIDPVDPNTVHVAVGNMLMKSTNGGNTFTLVLEGQNLSSESYYLNAIAIDPSDHQHVLVGGGRFYSPKVYGDLWESFDGGDTYVRNLLSSEDVIVNAILIDPDQPDTIYIGNGFSGGGTSEPIYRSLDGGASWQAMNSGLPPVIFKFNDLWGAASDQLMMVGYSDHIRHLSGDTLTHYDLGQLYELQAVWSSSPDDAYAVGAEGIIFHYNGTAWSPMVSPTSAYLSGLWGVGANDVFAVGFEGTVVHYDGQNWSLMNTGTSQSLYGLWGSSGADLYAVGEKGAIHHYNGTVWSSITAVTAETLNDIWGSRTDDIFVVGTGGVILHYNGSIWAMQNSPTTLDLNSVWGSGPSDVYAVGYSGTVLHYDGQTWSTLDSPTDRFPIWGCWGDSNGNYYFGDDHGGIYEYDGHRYTTLLQSGSTTNAVVDLAFHPQNKQVLYAATHQSGVFVSPNQARDWLQLGDPEYAVFSIATSSLYAATQGGLLQCTGTGVIAGRISHAVTGDMIDGATVFNDLGAQSISINGEYMMVSATGICDVIAVADNHQNSSSQSVSVLGGDITWVDLEMNSGVVEPPGTNPNNTSSASRSGGGYCFIQTATGQNSRLDFVAVWIGWCLVFVTLALIWQFAFRRYLHLVCSLASIVCIVVSYAVISLFCSCQDALAGTLFQQVGIAGSPNPVGSGARAQGMGGAFIAVADDATAASWNPAGLIQLEKPEASLVASRMDFQEAFSSDVRAEIRNTGDVDDTNVNYMSATVPFHWFKNMVVSVSYQRLFDFQRSFRHQLNFADTGLDLIQDKDFEQDGYVGALGIAGAVEITPKLSAGVTLNIWTDELAWDNGWTQRYKEQAVGSQGGVPVTIDTTIMDDYSKFRGINANIGILYNPIQALSIGAVIKTPFTASLLHEFRFNQTQSFGPPVDTTTTSNQTVIEDVDLEMPISYGIGMSWRASDALTLSADLYRTHWSDYILEDSQGNRFSPIDGRLESESDVKDTTQVRFGAEYLVILPEKGFVIPLRAGLFYDPEPGSGGARDFYGLALGTGIAYKRTIIDLAYNYRWGRDLDAGNLIATADADVSQHTLLVSVIYHFK